MSEKKLENAKQITRKLKRAETHFTESMGPALDTEMQVRHLVAGVSHLLTALSMSCRFEVEDEIEMLDDSSPEDEKPT